MLPRKLHGAAYVAISIFCFAGGFFAMVSLAEALELRGCLSTIVIFGGTTLCGTLPPLAFRKLVPARCGRIGCPGNSYIASAGKKLVYGCDRCGESATW